VAGLYTSDYNLIGRSLHDDIVEPLRGKFIPHFDQVKQAALNNGALGSGISGSGPSIFALSKGIDNARKVAEAMREIFDGTEIPYEIHVSKINSKGVKII
jgi:homoserine kinase